MLAHATYIFCHSVFCKKSSTCEYANNMYVQASGVSRQRRRRIPPTPPTTDNGKEVRVVM